MTHAEPDWDHETASSRAQPDGGSWREHCDHLHHTLVLRWTESLQVCRALKTDLFDEALGSGIVSTLAGPSREVHGIDVAMAVVDSAATRHPTVHAVGADVRDLPYGDHSFGLIASISTLDHFTKREDIDRSLGELFRTSEPGARVIVTLDNLANPIVALRAILPKRLLRAVGLVPYHVGPTLTLRGLERAARSVGFDVVDSTTLMHVPRVVAIPVCSRVDRRADSRRRTRLLRHLTSWERLGRWPTSRVTGHFVGILAVRP